MKNIVIDTNVLYCIYGRKELNMWPNNKVNESRLHRILNNNKVIVTSVTIVEIMSHFQDKPDLIMKLLNFIKERNFEIINCGIISYSQDDIIKLFSSSNYTLHTFIRNAIKEKIYTESGFAASFLLVELQMFVNFYFERAEHYKPNFKQMQFEEKDKLKCFLFDTIFQKDKNYNLDILENDFRKILDVYYNAKLDSNKKNSAKNVKDLFNEKLYEFCTSSTAFFELIIDNENYYEFTNDKLYLEYQKIISNNDCITEMSHNPKHASIGIKKLIYLILR